ncbi:hypothetical protein D9B84_25455 [Serratia marcescens]|uniref:hypothetical protein n=1 Tax=Serratia marcescens TaxID=615 RepID=UPI000F7F2BAF|nr:hypothetical protein [Serratia marcescens]RTF05409.1 hypothetical protein D9B84_25455 [Serratia marcescens]
MAGFATEYKDLLTISFSALSFIVACIALFFSVRTNIRDKEKLRITARAVVEPIYNKVYKIEVTIINVGRRIAVLEGVQCHYDQGYKCRDYIDEGIHLKEKERIKLYVERWCIIRNGDEGEVFQLENITVLDTQGKEYKIKNSKKLVERLIKEG